MHRPAPHRSPVARLVIGAALILLVASSLTPARAAIVPSDSPNRLDQPMADVALLERDGPDDAPRLLVVDAMEAAPGVRHLSILRRDSAWGVASELNVDVGASGRDPWLIGLSPSRFALLAVSAASNDTIVIGLRTDAGPGRNELAETGRTQFTTSVTDAGAADVDGDGTNELVLATARTIREGGTCQGSTVWVFDGSSLVTRAVHSVPGRRLAGGVVGRWDDVAGEDLLAYAYDNCPAGPDTASEASLMAIRLSDGGSILDRPDLAPITSSPVPPVRLDLDGTGTHEFLAMIRDGLAVLDPTNEWRATGFDSTEAFPVLASDHAGPDGQGVRVAWIHLAAGPATALVRRGRSGAVEVDNPGLFVDSEIDVARLRSGFREALAAGRHQAPAPGWIGATTDEGCADLLLPGAVLACDEPAMRAGAAWNGTRPMMVVLDGPDRRLLVAAGLTLDTQLPLVRTPSPWATGPAGWWRHGPSDPFALAELSAGDATYYREFPVPQASVERTTAPDATTAVPGFTGVRLFVRAAALEAEAPEPTGDIDLDASFGESAPEGDAIDVLRIPVPPGVEAGRDGGFARVSLGDVMLADGSHADRWSVAVVPINDWGEIGSVASGVVIRDAIGPSLVIEPPFTTPIWPFLASIPGAAEPRSNVSLAGVGSVELDRRGQFTIQTPLAPWPQTLVVTATDASGNITRREISVIGGVDYRRFPWATIVAAALLLAVVASGLVGNGWRRAGGGPGAAPGRPAYAIDDGPVAEMEDLPPGAGLR
ncbi:MAG: hypothetical protein ACSLFN_01030 [Candidatus Limnocylindrales bacterium]